jgi:hypothetical protein
MERITTSIFGKKASSTYVLFSFTYLEIRVNSIFHLYEKEHYKLMSHAFPLLDEKRFLLLVSFKNSFCVLVDTGKCNSQISRRI